MNLQDWTNASQIVALFVAVGALLYTAHEAKWSTATAKAQFWLELRKMFAEHQAVHLNLRPGGKWFSSGQGPTQAEEWASVEAYMGLFEHCERMLAEKLIDLNTFKAIYTYRLHNLLQRGRLRKRKIKHAKPVAAVATA